MHLEENTLESFNGNMNLCVKLLSDRWLTFSNVIKFEGSDVFKYGDRSMNIEFV